MMSKKEFWGTMTIKKRIKLLLLAALTSIMVNCAEHKKFDSIQWKNWTESESSPSLRWVMHKSLLEDNDLKGYNKQKILTCLESPTMKWGMNIIIH